MKATRQEWLDDLMAIDEMLYKFLVKHGRSGVNDLEMVYAIQDRMEYGDIVSDYSDAWVLGAELASTGFEVSELTDDYIRDRVMEDVREGLLFAELAEEVEG